MKVCSASRLVPTALNRNVVGDTYAHIAVEGA
jgi:hypothetical protein